MTLTIFGSYELQQKYTTRIGEECLDFIFTKPHLCPNG